MSGQPTLHLMCGKIASGKSTLAAALASQDRAVLLSEDGLLARLYPGEIASLEDYVRCTRRLREAIAPVIADLLATGVSVVLDFQGNTPAARAWMRTLITDGVRCQLHLLDVSDDECRARLRARNAAGTHDYQVSDEDFDRFTAYFTPPSPEEGFDVVVHRPG